MRRVPGAMLAGAAMFLVVSCAGKREGGEEDGDVSTDECVPYCERREAGGCNELGNVDSCKLACGLLLTEGTPCAAASKVLLDCRLKQANICTGCATETQKANRACVM